MGEDPEPGVRPRVFVNEKRPISTHARIMCLPALALVPLVAAQEPVDFRVEHRAGLAAYYRGEIEGAIAHFERCVEPGNEASDLYTAAQNLSLAMEVAGRRDEALHWAGVARGGQDRGTLHWFLAQEALEEMRPGPALGPDRRGARCHAGAWTPAPCRRRARPARGTGCDSIAA